MGFFAMIDISTIKVIVIHLLEENSTVLVSRKMRAIRLLEHAQIYFGKQKIYDIQLATKFTVR